MIDEFPILSIVAAFAKGETVMQGVGELRVKESDRIAAMEVGLKANGVTTSSTQDTFTVTGHSGNGVPGGAPVAAHLDHRIAMSFAVLGLAAERAVTVDDAAPIATSFPTFTKLMRELGAQFE
jgi:3-phosphoshikimate 1-carboxyvinyltransferase